MVNPRAIPDYAKWWRSIFTKAFTSPLECYLSKLIGGSYSKSSQPPQLATSKATAQAGSKPTPKSKSLTIKGKHLN